MISQKRLNNEKDPTCLTKQQNLHHHDDHQGSLHLPTPSMVIIVKRETSQENIAQIGKG